MKTYKDEQREEHIIINIIITVIVIPIYSYHIKCKFYLILHTFIQIF